MTRTRMRSAVALACVLALVFALAAPFAPAVPAILVEAGIALDPGPSCLLLVPARVRPPSDLAAASVPARAPPA